MKPFKHGFVTGKFYPPHVGHVHLVRAAARQCERVTVLALASHAESLDPRLRAAWLQDSVAALPGVVVAWGWDDLPVDYADPGIWEAHVELMRAGIRASGATSMPDVVYSSEAYGHELAERLGARHVCLDAPRDLYPISARAIRADPVAYWELLPLAARAGLALRVVGIGAESTGTTTVCRDLVAALRERGGSWARTAWVPEFGREFSADAMALARAFNPAARPEELTWCEQDFVTIAETQSSNEVEAARGGGPVLVCDTDALATTVWHERYRGGPSARVEAVAAAMVPRALYLLTDHEGVAFEDDGLRDGEHLRPWMTGRFREVVGASGVPWVELRGSREARLEQALRAVDARVAAGWGFTAPLPEANKP